MSAPWPCPEAPKGEPVTVGPVDAPPAAGRAAVAGANGVARPADGALLGGAPGASGPEAEGAASVPSFFAVVAADLAAVEAAIRATAAVDHALLQQTLGLILSASGKRLRPALVLLAARLHETSLRRRVDLACAAELLHTATLIHDDVLDVAAARRGQPTINAAFSNTLAVLTGDYLFGKSGELVAGLGSPAIMGVFSWAVMEVVRGEMLRPSLDAGLAAAERAYLAKIRGKTAALFAMCCQTGAMLDADDPILAARLRDYGLHLGMAFQIVDDVLDYTATEAQLGKPVGSDLRRGTITLPALYYLRDHPHDTLVRGLLTGEAAGPQRAAAAVQAIRGSGAIAAALARARTYAAAAAALLERLPRSPYVAALDDLACYVVERSE